MTSAPGTPRCELAAGHSTAHRPRTGRCPPALRMPAPPARYRESRLRSSHCLFARALMHPTETLRVFLGAPRLGADGPAMLARSLPDLRRLLLDELGAQIENQLRVVVQR